MILIYIDVASCIVPTYNPFYRQPLYHYFDEGLPIFSKFEFASRSFVVLKYNHIATCSEYLSMY